MEAAVRTPVTIALVNDYDIVVMGIAHILEQYQDRVVIAELDTNVAVFAGCDIVDYTTDFVGDGSATTSFSTRSGTGRARSETCPPTAARPPSSGSPASQS